MGLTLEEIAAQFGEKVEVTLENAIALESAETASDEQKFGKVRQIENPA